MCGFKTVSSSSVEIDSLWPLGEGQGEGGMHRVSPSDPIQSLNVFTRKIGAFVNKPNTQVSPLPFDGLIIPRYHDISAYKLYVENFLKPWLGFCFMFALVCVFVCRYQQPV